MGTGSGTFFHCPLAMLVKRMNFRSGIEMTIAFHFF